MVNGYLVGICIGIAIGVVCTIFYNEWRKR